MATVTRDGEFIVKTPPKNIKQIDGANHFPHVAGHEGKKFLIVSSLTYGVWALVNMGQTDNKNGIIAKVHCHVKKIQRNPLTSIARQ